MPRRRASLLAVCLACAAPAAGQSLEARYRAAQSSWERRAVVASADPADAKALRFLQEVLKKEEWFQREAAVDVLARVEDPALVAKLEKEKDPAVLEGVLLAWGRPGRPERVPFLLEQLRARKDAPRRAAAIALGRTRDVRAVEALIAAWEQERRYEVWIHMAESLERLTGQRGLRRPEDWRGWWEAVGVGYALPEGEGAEADDGEAIRTRARGTRLDLRSRGQGAPLLVLPEYGYEHDYLQRWLRDLEDTQQVLYLTLPGAADFTDPPLEPAPDLPDPYYPLERLTDALEALHAELVAQKKIQDRPFALLAHGLTCWVAMTYAARHPDRVRRMVLVAPYSSGDAWESGRARVEAEGQRLGDQEMVHFAQSQLYEGYVAQSPEEEAALERKEWTLYFADPRELEIGHLWGPVVEKQDAAGDTYELRRLVRPLGTVAIPDFALSALPRTPTPTLVVHGDLSVRASLEDAGVVAKHYLDQGRVLRLKGSRRAPFFSEHDAFVRAVRKFLD